MADTKIAASCTVPRAAIGVDALSQVIVPADVEVSVEADDTFAAVRHPFDAALLFANSPFNAKGVIDYRTHFGGSESVTYNTELSVVGAKFDARPQLSGNEASFMARMFEACAAREESPPKAAKLRTIGARLRELAASRPAEPTVAKK